MFRSHCLAADKPIHVEGTNSPEESGMSKVGADHAGFKRHIAPNAARYN